MGFAASRRCPRMPESAWSSATATYCRSRAAAVRRWHEEGGILDQDLLADRAGEDVVLVGGAKQVTAGTAGGQARPRAGLGDDGAWRSEQWRPVHPQDGCARPAHAQRHLGGRTAGD